MGLYGTLDTYQMYVLGEWGGAYLSMLVCLCVYLIFENVVKAPDKALFSDEKY